MLNFDASVFSETYTECNLSQRYICTADGHILKMTLREVTESVCHEYVALEIAFLYQVETASNAACDVTVCG